MLEPSPAISVLDLRKVYADKAAVDGSPYRSRAAVSSDSWTQRRRQDHHHSHVDGPGAATSGSIEVLAFHARARRRDQAQDRRGSDESVLFDRLTGREFLEFVGRMYALERRVAAERARELLGLFELQSSPKKLIAEYSKVCASAWPWPPP